MAVESPRTMTDEQLYAQAASAYYASLPLEHFAQSMGQSTQRQMTLESFDLIRVVRPDVHIFSELLVQYGPVTAIMRVVPDSMVVIHDAKSRPTTVTTFRCKSRDRISLSITYPV